METGEIIAAAICIFVGIAVIITIISIVIIIVKSAIEEFKD